MARSLLFTAAAVAVLQVSAIKSALKTGSHLTTTVAETFSGRSELALASESIQQDFCLDSKGLICNECLVIYNTPLGVRKDCKPSRHDGCVQYYNDAERDGPRVHKSAWCGGCNFEGSYKDMVNEAEEKGGAKNIALGSGGATDSSSVLKHYVNRFIYSGKKDAFCPFCLKFDTDGESTCHPHTHSAEECRRYGTGSWCPGHPNFPVWNLCRLGWHGDWCNGCLVDLGGAWPRCDINLSKSECLKLKSPHVSSWCPTSNEDYPTLECSTTEEFTDRDGSTGTRQVANCRHGCLVRWSDGTTKCMGGGNNNHGDGGPIWKESECLAAAGRWSEEVIDLSLEVQFKRVAAATKWCGYPTTLNKFCTESNHVGTNVTAKVCGKCFEWSRSPIGQSQWACNNWVNEKRCLDYQEYKCMLPSDHRDGSCGTAWCPNFSDAEIPAKTKNVYHDADGISHPTSMLGETSTSTTTTTTAGPVSHAA